MIKKKHKKEKSSKNLVEQVEQLEHEFILLKKICEAFFILAVSEFDEITVKRMRDEIIEIIIKKCKQ